jgi:HPt (histidine-containing phosphotransfer) domain-containing protein
MIDWSRVEQLQDEVGLEDFGEVVDLFLEEVEETLGILGQSVPDSDLEGHMHFLKGSALNLGFADLSQLCRDGEREAANGHSERIDLSAILACYTASKAAFLSRLAGTAAA